MSMHRWLFACFSGQAKGVPAADAVLRVTSCGGGDEGAIILPTPTPLAWSTRPPSMMSGELTACSSTDVAALVSAIDELREQVACLRDGVVKFEARLTALEGFVARLVPPKRFSVAGAASGSATLRQTAVLRAAQRWSDSGVTGAGKSSAVPFHLVGADGGEWPAPPRPSRDAHLPWGFPAVIDGNVTAPGASVRTSPPSLSDAGAIVYAIPF